MRLLTDKLSTSVISEIGWIVLCLIKNSFLSSGWWPASGSVVHKPSRTVHTPHSLGNAILDPNRYQKSDIPKGANALSLWNCHLQASLITTPSSLKGFRNQFRSYASSLVRAKLQGSEQVVELGSLCLMNL